VTVQLGGLLVLAALLSGAGFFADVLGEPTPEAGDRYGEGRDIKFGL